MAASNKRFSLFVRSMRDKYLKVFDNIDLRKVISCKWVFNEADTRVQFNTDLFISRSRYLYTEKC